jgi:hypothetical protein
MATEFLAKPLPWVPPMPGTATYVLREAQKEIQRLNEEILRLSQEVERLRFQNGALDGDR